MILPTEDCLNGPVLTVSEPPTVLYLPLQVTDTDSIAELLLHTEGRGRDEYALSALRIGLLSLKHARGQVDADAVRREGEKLLAELNHSLEGYRKQLHEQLAGALREYFDPNSGRLPERIERLIKKDGELEQALRGQIGSEGSELVRTLASFIGPNSVLMKTLDPADSQGLVSTLQRSVEGVLETQRNLVLEEFSLDSKDSALSRMIREITEQSGKLRGDLASEVQAVVGEFSLDKPDSALSRLLNKVEEAQRRITEEFSLDNEKSALSRMSGHLEQTRNAINESLTLDKPESALARLRREITDTLERHEHQAKKFQNEVTATLEAIKTKREEARRSTVHGREFEDMVFEFIQRGAQRLGDMPLATGDTTGAIKYCKVGDAIIEMGSESAAPGQRIVIEAKEDASYNLGKARIEIETARKNRGASVGVFVFSKKSAPIGQEPLLRHGDDLFVTWDADDLNSDVIFQAGISLARALCVRQQRSHQAESANLHDLDAAILAIEAEAKRLAQMKSWTETIHSNSERLMREVSKMQKSLEEQVEVLRNGVSGLRETTPINS